MFCTLGNIELGVDTLSEARKNWTHCNEEDKPCAPVPASIISVDAVRIVHVTNIEFLVADEVEVGYEDTSDGTHETCVAGEESEKLSTLDDN